MKAKAAGMERWGIGEYVCAILVGAMLLFFVRGFPRAIDDVRRARRREAEEAAVSAPDWSSISDYVDLANAAASAFSLPVEAFLDGPFRRFLEICSDPGDHPRSRARAMEFGRGVLAAYRENQSECDPVYVHRRARAMAAEWFARPEIPNGDYMLEVFDGVSDHNGRGNRDLCR